MSTKTKNPLSWQPALAYEQVTLSEAARRYKTTYSTMRNWVRDGKVQKTQIWQTRKMPHGKEIGVIVDGAYAPLLDEDRTRVEHESYQALLSSIEYLRCYVGYAASQFNLFGDGERWRFLLKSKDVDRSEDYMHIDHLKATKEGIIDFDTKFFTLSEYHQRLKVCSIIASCYFEPLREHLTYSFGSSHSIFHPVKEIEHRITLSFANVINLPGGEIGIEDNDYSRVRVELE